MQTQDALQPALRRPAAWLALPMSWLRPNGIQGGREAYQLRFLCGAVVLATAVSALAVAAAAAMGQWLGVAVSSGFLFLIVLQAAAVRFGAPIRVVAWTVIATVGLLLVVSAALPSTNASGQLYWFLLIPLAARAFSAPRHDSQEEPRSWRIEFLAGVAALAAVVVVIALRPASFDAAPIVSSGAHYALGIDVALFLLSALGLLYVHDLSVRETAAELRRLQELLAVCAWCRKISHAGEWIGVEEYLAQRQNVELTHGMCPACHQKHFPSAPHPAPSPSAGTGATPGDSPSGLRIR